MGSGASSQQQCVTASLIGVSESVVVLQLCETSSLEDIVAQLLGIDSIVNNEVRWLARRKVASTLQNRNEWQILDLNIENARIVVNIGVARIAEINLKHLLEAESQIIKTEKINLRLCRIDCNKLKSRRIRIFAIRHAESLWNQGNPLVMMSSIDHGLSSCGIAQAKCLDELVSRCNSESSELEHEFCQCNKIYSSPHKRTVQTSLLALRRHPQVKQHGIELLSVLREIRANKQCRDNMTSTRGEDIRKCAVEGILKQEQCNNFKEEDLPYIDATDADHEWWSTTTENSQDARSRIAYFLQHILLSDQDHCIIVTHSNFLRTLFRSRANSKVAGTLANNKLQHCAVVAIDVDFSRLPGEEITSGGPLFSNCSTGVVDEWFLHPDDDDAAIDDVQVADSERQPQQ